MYVITEIFSDVTQRDLLNGSQTFAEFFYLRLREVIRTSLNKDLSMSSVSLQQNAKTTTRKLSRPHTST